MWKTMAKRAAGIRTPHRSSRIHHSRATTALRDRAAVMICHGDIGDDLPAFPADPPPKDGLSGQDATPWLDNPLLASLLIVAMVIIYIASTYLLLNLLTG